MSEAFFNKSEALDRLGGDEELFETMSSMFIADSEGYCRALDEALAAADAPSVRREAHTIKGLLAAFSFDAGRDLALKLENQAASGSLLGIEALAGEVKTAVRQLAQALSA